MTFMIIGNGVNTPPFEWTLFIAHILLEEYYGGSCSSLKADTRKLDCHCAKGTGRVKLVKGSEPSHHLCFFFAGFCLAVCFGSVLCQSV